MNDPVAKRSFVVSTAHKHGRSTRQPGVSGRYVSCPFQSVRRNGDGLPPSPRCSRLPMQTRVLCLDWESKAGPGHGAAVTMGPGEGSQCGTLGKRRGIFILNDMYFAHFQCPMGHLHPDTRPGSLCLRWQASAVGCGCGVLAQLFCSLASGNKLFSGCAFYTP